MICQRCAPFGACVCRFEDLTAPAPQPDPDPEAETYVPGEAA